MRLLLPLFLLVLSGIFSMVWITFARLGEFYKKLGDIIYRWDIYQRYLFVIITRNATFSSICDAYVEYDRSKYLTDCVTVCDGYIDGIQNCNTKYAERVRREGSHSSLDILVNGSIFLDGSSRYIFIYFLIVEISIHLLLKDKFRTKYFEVRQAPEDDSFIVHTANIEVENYN